MPGALRTKCTPPVPQMSDHLRERRSTMGGKTDEMKGRAKEAAGALSGDSKLKREGKVDQTVGKVKQMADKVIDKIKRAVS
jgi:uncharacterized protein YjbJ (UPF0337 family)